MRCSLTVLLLVGVLAAPASATWSILIVDTRTGELAVGSATCLTGFNLRTITPVVLVGRGAACAQALVNISSVANRQIIWNMLQSGAPPQAILAALAAADPQHGSRQYGIIDATGGKVTFTGESTFAWAGGVTGSVGTIHYAIQGNILTGAAVVSAAEQAVLNTPGDLAGKLMAAMQAARTLGGDGRCSCSPVQPTACGAPPVSFAKSAHIGFMVVARRGDTDGSCISPAVGCASGNYYMTLDVANQNAAAPDPVVQLQTQFNAWRGSLVGRPDHHLSTVTADPPQLWADGVTQSMVTVVLRDWTGAPLTTGGASVVPSLGAGSTASAVLGPVTDHGDGSYSFPVTAGSTPGDLRLRISVHDGVSPVLLGPGTLIRQHTGALWADGGIVSAADGRTISFQLDAGTSYAGRTYLLGGSLSGTTPGLLVTPTLTVPLNPDPFLTATITTFQGSGLLSNALGTLDANGQATALLQVQPGQAVSLAGVPSDWAFLTLSPPDMASNPVPVLVVP